MRREGKRVRIDREGGERKIRMILFSKVEESMPSPVILAVAKILSSGKKLGPRTSYKL